MPGAWNTCVGIVPRPSLPLGFQIWDLNPPPTTHPWFPLYHQVIRACQLKEGPRGWPFPPTHWPCPPPLVALCVWGDQQDGGLGLVPPVSTTNNPWVPVHHLVIRACLPGGWDQQGWLASSDQAIRACGVGAALVLSVCPFGVSVMYSDQSFCC